MTPVDEVLRQLSRVRRRRMAYTLQRALYVLLGAAGIAVTLVVTLALLGGPWVFAAGSVAAPAALGVALVYVFRDVRRAFDGPRRVAFWVDRTAALGGRLATLVEVAPRRPLPALLPLLVEQNTARLTTWGPSRAVPRVVPLAALAAAVTGMGSLGLVLHAAPRLAPSPPEIIEGDDAPAGGVAVDGSGQDGGRFVLAPVETRDEGSSGAGSIPAPGRGSAGTPSTSSLQERIRRGVWGSAWERLRQAAATSRAGERAPGGSGRDADKATGGAALPEDRLAREAGEPRESDRQRAIAPAERGGGETLRPGDPLEQRGTANSGEAAPGAGTGSSPADLYGPPINKHSATNAFELALDAPGRGQAPAPRPPTGETPAASPDERPQLAARQRPETAVSHMPVPAAYEPIVRALFAHVETTP